MRVVKKDLDNLERRALEVKGVLTKARKADLEVIVRTRRNRYRGQTKLQEVEKEKKE